MNASHEYTPQDFGAKADGWHDDSKAINDAIEAALSGERGCVFLPPGLYRCLQPVYGGVGTDSLTIRGCGAGVSDILVAHDGEGMRFDMEQEHIHQPYKLNLFDFSLITSANPERGIHVTFGNPALSNEHFGTPVRIKGVEVRSSPYGSFRNGILLDGVWNPLLEDVFVSGNSCGGNWNVMQGAGIELRGMCVNTHLSNVRMNFWAEGLKVHANPRNTEGIFASNCHMVAVKRGVWIKGNPDYKIGEMSVPRIHTLNWMGGMIENRVGGVTGGSASFHLEHVWSASIQGCQMITETLDTVENTYGVVAQDCKRVLISGCEINAYTYPVATTGTAEGHNITGNSFPNCKNGVAFLNGAVNCIDTSNT